MNSFNKLELLLSLSRDSNFKNALFLRFFLIISSEINESFFFIVFKESFNPYFLEIIFFWKCSSFLYNCSASLLNFNSLSLFSLFN